MNKCLYYQEKTYNYCGQLYTYTVCRDKLCSCDGKRINCTHYPSVRESAMNEMHAIESQMELEFYRYYIQKHDLLYDACTEYKKWKESRSKNNPLTIYTEDESYTVSDPQDLHQLASALKFKADHMKAKASPELFMILSHALEALWKMTEDQKKSSQE